MARITRLLCVLGVLSLSTSAFASIIVPITDDEPANDAMATATVLTTGRTGTESVSGYFTTFLNIDPSDSDYFQVDLLQGDYLMVNTSILLPPPAATTVTLYDSGGAVVPGGAGAAAYIDNVSVAGTYYIGITGNTTASYMMSVGIGHVPEPATMAFLAIGGVMLIKRRRKR
jgi:hypothetical protein